MAKQVGPDYYTGKRGNKIGYKIKGIYYERSMPIEVKRSEATKEAALDFGMASKAGKLVRNALQPKLDIPSDDTVTNRLNQTLIPVIKLDNFSALLEGFNFNTHTSLEKLLKQKPTLQKHSGDTFLLQVPEQHISKTHSTTHIEIKAIAVSINFTKHKHTALKEEVLLIDMKMPFTGATLTLPAPGNDTTLYVLQVRALELVNRKYYDVENRRYYAAEIIAVMPERTLTPVVKNKMQDIKKLLPQKAKAKAKTTLFQKLCKHKKSGFSKSFDFFNFKHYTDLCKQRIFCQTTF